MLLPQKQELIKIREYVATSLPVGVVSSLAALRRPLASIFAMLGRRGCCISIAGFWLFLACFSIPSSALAETIPATVETIVVSDLEQHPVYVCAGQLLESFSGCLPVLNAAYCCSVVYEYLVSETTTNFTVHYRYVYESGGGNSTFSKHIVGGCPAGSTWNGSACVATTYSCPFPGTWMLSADKLTCNGCHDSSQTLNQDNACVGLGDKDAGERCEKPSGSSSQPNPFHHAAADGLGLNLTYNSLLGTSSTVQPFGQKWRSS